MFALFGDAVVDALCGLPSALEPPPDNPAEDASFESGHFAVL